MTNFSKLYFGVLTKLLLYDELHSTVLVKQVRLKKMTTSTTTKPFATQIYCTDTNGERMSVKSPKTGKTITIWSGWYSYIPDEIKDKTMYAFRMWEHNLYMNRNKETTSAMDIYAHVRNTPFYAQLTAAELTTLYTIYKDQQKKLRR